MNRDPGSTVAGWLRAATPVLLVSPPALQAQPGGPDEEASSFALQAADQEWSPEQAQGVADRLRLDVEELRGHRFRDPVDVLYADRGTMGRIARENSLERYPGDLVALDLAAKMLGVLPPDAGPRPAARRRLVRARCRRRHLRGGLRQLLPRRLPTRRTGPGPHGRRARARARRPAPRLLDHARAPARQPRRALRVPLGRGGQRRRGRRGLADARECRGTSWRRAPRAAPRELDAADRPALRVASDPRSAAQRPRVPAPYERREPHAPRCPRGRHRPRLRRATGVERTDPAPRQVLEAQPRRRTAPSARRSRPAPARLDRRRRRHARRAVHRDRRRAVRRPPRARVRFGRGLCTASR